MIRVERDSRFITLRGHAGWGPAGQDIVCAAVSCLVETMAAGPEGSAVRLGPGTARLPGDGTDAEFVWRGLCLLAESFPEHIVLNEIGKRGKRRRDQNRRSD